MSSFSSKPWATGEPCFVSGDIRSFQQSLAFLSQQGCGLQPSTALPCSPEMQQNTGIRVGGRPRLTIKSERWSEPELNPLVSESEGLLERESKRERESRRAFLSAGVENFSDRSEPTGSRGRKPSGGFPRTFPRGLLSMPRTATEKEPINAAAQRASFPPGSCARSPGRYWAPIRP